MKFFKVTDKNVEKLMEKFFDDYNSAFDDMLRFSRRQGGSRSRLGISKPWGSYSVAIVFTKQPDRSIWKKARKDSSEYWVPKATAKAKEINKEFQALVAAFPVKWDVYNALEYDPFNFGFGNWSKHCGIWVLATGADFEPKNKQKKQLKRMSDVEYEKLYDRHKSER